MTTLFIIGMWVVTIASMYAFMNVSFWVFAQIFGMIDSYMQDRYWARWNK